MTSSSSSSTSEPSETTTMEVDTTATWSSDADYDTQEEGNGASSWPAAEEIESKLTKRSQLRDLCKTYGVPADAYKPHVAGENPVCAPPGEGHHDITVYADAIGLGMRLPLHDFYVEVLRHYGLAPSQLVPNSWRYMAAFVLLCEDAQVQPMVSVFQHFFTLYNQGKGWHHFRSSGHHFKGRMPGHPSNHWRSRFFILRSPVPWPCPVKWGEPRDAAMCMPTLTPEAKAVVKKLEKKSIAITGQHDKSILPFLSDRIPLVRGSVPVAREVKREVEANANNGVKHTTKRKAPEPATTQAPHQQGPSTPLGFASGGSERSATRDLLGLVQDAMTEVEGKEKELQAAKGEVAQLKLELVVARDDLRLLKEANAAEVARLKEELQHAAAELEAAKLQSPERYVKVLKKMRHQIASLLLEEAEEPPSTSSKLTGACSSRARKGH